MINNVVLVGRLTKDPELRYTANNLATANFTIAVTRQFKNANGERDSDFINCVIWRQSAENLASWCKKGQLIGVTGSIQTRNYENSSGQRVYVTEVNAQGFQVLEKRDSNAAGGAPQQRQQSPQNNPLGGTPMDISDDDLPF